MEAYRGVRAASWVCCLAALAGCLDAGMSSHASATGTVRPSEPEPEPAPPAVAAVPDAGVTVAAPTVTTFTSPGGLAETCQLLVPFPFTPDGAGRDDWYRQDDFDEIAELCAMDFYAPADTPAGPAVGVCPKIHGTQPALEIYDLADARVSKGRFEEERCPRFRKEREAKKVAKLKFSIFARERESALFYFHFSRLLGNLGFVYPATYRSIALAELARWAQEGLTIIRAGDAPKSPGGGWFRVRQVGRSQPDDSHVRVRRARRVLLDPDRPQLALGTLAKNPRGERAHERFSYLEDKRRIGTAAGMRLTTFYKLVHSERPIPAGTSLQELAYARDFTAYVILDHLFHQRDRSGNIHEKRYHHFVDAAGRLHWKAKLDEDDPADAVPLTRLILKDNDEGLIWGNSPQLDASELIGELRHLDPVTYERIQWLAGLMRDPATAEVVKAWFLESVHVTEESYTQVRERFLEMAEGFERLHRDGRLQLDLDVAKWLVEKPPAPAKRRVRSRNH